MNKEQSFAAPSDVDFNAEWHKVEQEEFTSFLEKLHLVGAEAGTDLEGNSAQIWDICEPLERLLGIMGMQQGVHLEAQLDGAGSVAEQPSERQLLLSKISPWTNISTDFLLQGERLWSFTPAGGIGFFSVHISVRRQSTGSSVPSEWKLLSLL